MNSLVGLFKFINASPTAYHAVATAEGELRSNGYTRLFEGEKWSLTDGGKYYVIRNGSSLIAFRYTASANGFASSSVWESPVMCLTHSYKPAYPSEMVE